LSEAEARVIAGKLEIEWERFVNDYTDRRWPGTDSYLTKHNSNGCLFLEGPVAGKQYLCQIHAFKPKCCLDWQFGADKPECREGLKDRWNLTLDSAGSLSGPPQVLQEFKDFLKSLDDPG
jgi:hypothetical protein